MTGTNVVPVFFIVTVTIPESPDIRDAGYMGKSVITKVDWVSADTAPVPEMISVKTIHAVRSRCRRLFLFMENL
nr:hypothetical protein [uncultured Methanocorpusculum sp.]